MRKLSKNGKPFRFLIDTKARMVVADGLEPSTPALSRRCSNQLSYATIRVSGGAGRSRTDDILLAKQALYQLSYGPLRGQVGGQEIR